MGVLYFGIDITLPSVLWMRRMLEGLGTDVATVVMEVEPGEEIRQRYSTLVLKEGITSLGWRGLRKLRLLERAPVSGKPLRALSTALRAPEISVALVHYVTLAVKYAAVWRRVQKPIFVHCHGYDVTWDLRVPGNPQQREHPSNYVDRVLALPHNVFFIANSAATAAKLLEIGIAEERISIKHLGTRVPTEVPPQALPERPLSDDFNILYLGRLIDCKGPELVIQAFDLACQQGLEGRLILAGDGPRRSACEAAAQSSAYRGNIQILGAVDEQQGIQLRRKAHVFTAHNRFGPESHQEEAFGVSLVEAMADGLPIVSGRNGSLPEVIEDGQQGILVEPGDIQAHAAALLKLAKEPELRRQMGLSGWRRARERFTIEQEMNTLRHILGLRETDRPGTQQT